MPIVNTIDTASQFRDAFVHAGRKDQFSYQALGLLFDFFNDFDENIELDVIAICCEYQECTEEEVRDYYRIDADKDIEDYLNDKTLYVGKTDDGSYVFASF